MQGPLQLYPGESSAEAIVLTIPSWKLGRRKGEGVQIREPTDLVDRAVIKLTD